MCAHILFMQVYCMVQDKTSALDYRQQSRECQTNWYFIGRETLTLCHRIYQIHMRVCSLCLSLGVERENWGEQQKRTRRSLYSKRNRFCSCFVIFLSANNSHQIFCALMPTKIEGFGSTWAHTLSMRVFHRLLLKKCDCTDALKQQTIQFSLIYSDYKREKAKEHLPRLTWCSFYLRSAISKKVSTYFPKA